MCVQFNLCVFVHLQKLGHVSQPQETDEDLSMCVGARECVSSSSTDMSVQQLIIQTRPVTLGDG